MGDSMEANKQLYRVEEGKVFSGVCAGFSEYLNMDVGLVRVIVVLAFIFSGFFPIVIAYIVLAIILPSKQEAIRRAKEKNDAYNQDDYTIDEDDYKY
jgi:phage shock protein C